MADMVDDQYQDDLTEYGIDDSDIIESGTLTLTISKEMFDSRILLDKKQFSEPGKVAGFEWRILCFPSGNDDSNTNISFFIEFKDCVKLGPKDKVFTSMLLSVESDVEPSRKNTDRIFDRNCKDWGFAKFLAINDVTNPSKGFLSDDHPLTLTARVTVCKGESQHWIDSMPYDSKKMTGFVGLKNQGATCYMNSILQTLYFTNQLRMAVFQMPTEGEENESSVALALQRVFYQLQTDDDAADTQNLTKSFGWTSGDSFMQHDVQEFSRVLMDNLENKMKDTVVDGVIGKLFEGKMKSYIKCCDVDYESSRSESYYDIQLNVKGMKDLAESFKDYVEIELLNGDNKYRAEGHGLQDAEKGVIFQSFPPVLHLQLKRFEYDMYADQMVKINDRHEFPERINLDSYLENPEDTPANYTLHAVLVHAGDVNSGHYIVYNKPKINGSWYKFDDDRVTKVAAEDAVEGNYGVDPPSNNYDGRFMPQNRERKMRQFTNAYMLVYVRDSEIDEVLKEITTEDVPYSLRHRFGEEEEEEIRKFRQQEEENKFVEIVLLRLQDMKGVSCAFGVYPEDDEHLVKFKLFREQPIGELKQKIEEQFGVPIGQQKLWKLLKTNADSRSYGDIMEIVKFDDSKEVALLDYTDQRTVKIFVEEPSTDIHDVTETLLFFKHYDPLEKRLEVVDYQYINKSETVESLIPLFEKLAQDNGPLTIFAEQYQQGKLVNFNYTLSKTKHGEVFCFQSQNDDYGSCDFPTVQSYLDKMSKRTRIPFKSTEHLDQEPFELNLSTDMSYDEVADHVANYIKVDCPERIQFVTQNILDEKPDKNISRIHMGKVRTLEEMMPYRHRKLLFFEVLDTSVEELESKIDFTVNYGNNTHQVLMNSEATAKEIVDYIIQLEKLDETAAWRLIEIRQHQIFQDVDLDNLCKTLRSSSTLIVEAIPEDEMELDGETQKIVQVCHFNKRPVQLHGTPFFLVLNKDEKYSVTRERIRKGCGVPESVFSKWRVAHVNPPNCYYYDNRDDDSDDEDDMDEDSENVVNIRENFDEKILFNEEFKKHDFIGIDHPGRSQRGNIQQQSIVIHN